MTSPIVVVGAVFERGGEYFACRRAPGKADAGLWEFPGGKVEAGESHEAALRREVLEELGVSIEVEQLIDRTVTATGGRLIDLATYAVRATGPHPTTSTDHDELRWVPAARLLELPWATPDLPTIRALRRAP